MTHIGIILGSTRPGRKAEDVGGWLLQLTQDRTDATFDTIDLRDFPLPYLDEPMPPSFGQYQNDHTQRWAQKIAGYDGFIIVTPEYNHSTTGVLKNALDFLFAEWNNKAVGFVSYGAHGGVRAVEHLRTMAGELMMADVRAQVVLTLGNDFENYRTFAPGPQHAATVSTMLDQVIGWAHALAPLRSSATTA